MPLCFGYPPVLIVFGLSLGSAAENFVIPSCGGDPLWSDPLKVVQSLLRDLAHSDP